MLSSMFVQLENVEGCRAVRVYSKTVVMVDAIGANGHILERHEIERQKQRHFERRLCHRIQELSKAGKAIQKAIALALDELPGLQMEHDLTLFDDEKPEMVSKKLLAEMFPDWCNAVDETSQGNRRAA